MSSHSLARHALVERDTTNHPAQCITTPNATHSVTLTARHGRSLERGPGPGNQSSILLGGQPTLQSYQNRQSSRGGLQVVNSGMSLSEHEPPGPTHVNFVGSLGGYGSGRSIGGGCIGGGGGGGGGGGDVVRPTSSTDFPGGKGTIATNPTSPSRNRVAPNASIHGIHGSIPKKRMGSLMLRELSRRDVLGPQSGTTRLRPVRPIHSFYTHKYILSTHLLNPPSQHTFSTHLINPPSQPTLSTHPINTSSQHTLSIHPLYQAQ